MLLFLSFMHASPVPWKVLASHLGVGVLTKGWTLDVVWPPHSEQSRSFVVDVVFDSPFSSIPVVQLGITGFDIDQRESARLTLKAENITESGFQAVISTWENTRVFAVEFHWLAIGP
jgi:hypothetical protein